MRAPILHFCSDTYFATCVLNRRYSIKRGFEISNLKNKALIIINFIQY